jgi:hypothetical protein
MTKKEAKEICLYIWRELARTALHRMRAFDSGRRAAGGITMLARGIAQETI